VGFKKKKPANSVISEEVAEVEISEPIEVIEKTIEPAVVSDPCEGCKYKKGSVQCKTCINN